MLTFTNSKEKQSTCLSLLGNARPQSHVTNLLSSNTNLISNNVSLISDNANSGLDTCSFYSEPSNAVIMAYGETYGESCGSIAYDGESCGSVAYSGSGESCGSIASSGGFSAGGSSSCGGGCSYSC